MVRVVRIQLDTSLISFDQKRTASLNKVVIVIPYTLFGQALNTRELGLASSRPQFVNYCAGMRKQRIEDLDYIMKVTDL